MKEDGKARIKKRQKKDRQEERQAVWKTRRLTGWIDDKKGGRLD